MAKSAVSTRKSAAVDNMYAKTEEIEPAEEVVVSKKIKRTFHLDDDIVDLLEHLQLAEKSRNNNKRPNLSDLVAEGIKLLAKDRNFATPEKL